MRIDLYDDAGVLRESERLDDVDLAWLIEVADGAHIRSILRVMKAIVHDVAEDDMAAHAGMWTPEMVTLH